jgi:threonine dehydratase
MMDTAIPLPTRATIEETRRLIAPYVLRTPLHEWRGREIDQRITPATQVNLKLELFQHSGTFKARGAVSVMLRLSPEALARGVTAVSAGNHAIATAYAARALGTSAKVVMLSSANPARIARCRALGAELVMAPDGKTAFERASAIASEEGRTFVHPFEGVYTALGTATLGVEWLEQAGTLDAVIIPVGGGGLCAGVSAAIKLNRPDCLVFGVEPVGADTMHRSFAAGQPASRADVATIADSLAPPYALPYSFELCRRNVDQLVMIDDEQIRAAMGLLFREMKLAVEPAGAVATAALLGPLRDRLRGARVGVLICGANIDIASFAEHVVLGQRGGGGRVLFE